MSQVTTGAIRILYDEDKSNPLHNNPTVQIINVKAVNVQGGNRHRVIVSDGINFMQAMLATQHSQLVIDGKLKRNSIITLREFVCNALQNRKILIILNFDIVQSDVENKIGSPTSLDKTASPASSSPSATPVPTKTDAPATSQSSFTSQPSFTAASGVNMQLEANITPIMNLNPYQTRWHIKARVTQKTPIKKWHNARGDGQLFSCNFLDQTGEIRATVFNDQVDRFYNLLEEGKVFYISKARVVMAKKQFSNLNNEYELQLEKATEIEACPEAANIPKLKFDVVKIADLQNFEKGANVDVMGVVIEDQGVSEIVSKLTGKPSKKRDIAIADDSLRSIRLTIWDNNAENLDLSNNPILACKGARLNDFNGRSLNVSNNTVMKINPDIPEVQKLQKWFSEQGHTAHFNPYSNGLASATGSGDVVNISKKITLQQAKAEGLGTQDKNDYFSFRGTVVYIKTENPAYPACPECKKKVLMEETGWRCEKCQKSYPAPDYRYILTCSVEDETSQIYVNGFDDLGRTLLKMDANEFMALKDNDSTAAQIAVNKALFNTFNFKIRAKQESYNDMQRTKFNCIDVSPIDFVKESQEICEEIDKLLA